MNSSNIQAIVKYFRLKKFYCTCVRLDEYFPSSQSYFKL
jgi:hypothetical protein